MDRNRKNGVSNLATIVQPQRGQTGGRFRPTRRAQRPVFTRMVVATTEKTWAGDCWTGDNTFAATHLQPDYVESILLPNDLSAGILMEEM
jgi:hypothetical protein